MKKTKAVLLLASLFATSAFAKNPDQEICLNFKSNAENANEVLHIFSYTGLKDGHMLIYGESCYNLPATNQEECVPSTGSGILHTAGESFEFALHGSEFLPSMGNAFVSNDTNFNLNINSLSGTYKTMATLHGDGSETISLPDSGTVQAVQCPNVTKEELLEDKKFSKAIKNLDIM